MFRLCNISAWNAPHSTSGQWTVCSAKGPAICVVIAMTTVQLYVYVCKEVFPQML